MIELFPIINLYSTVRIFSSLELLSFFLRCSIYLVNASLSKYEKSEIIVFEFLIFVGVCTCLELYCIFLESS